MLASAHNMQRISLAFTSLEQLHKDFSEFLTHIVWVMGDETWKHSTLIPVVTMLSSSLSTYIKKSKAIPVTGRGGL
jgi:hypothetical protein